MANEESVVAVEAGAEPMATELKGKKTKEPKAKKPKAATKAAPSHPPYADMIKDAIATLKERTGSSQHAITKFVEEKHKSLPGNFRKLLLGNLRKMVASGQVTKVKGSFKLPSAENKKKPIPVAIMPKSDKKKATKVKKTPTKATKPKEKAVSAMPKVKAVRASTRSTPGKKVAVTKKAVVKKGGAPKKVKSPVKKAVGAKKVAKKAKK